MVKRGSSSRPLLFLLLLLVASLHLHSVLVTAELEEAAAELFGGLDALRESFGETIKAGAQKVAEIYLNKRYGDKGKDAVKGIKVGAKAYKIVKKRLHDVGKADDQLFPGGAAAVPAVGITTARGPLAGSILPVVAADVTSVAGVVERTSCTGSPVKLPQATVIGITLFTVSRAAVLTRLAYLPGAAFLDCPGGGGAPAMATLALGRGGALATMFPTFTYRVQPGIIPSSADVWLGAGRTDTDSTGRRARLFFDPANPSLYYVKITGISVGRQQLVSMQAAGAAAGEASYNAYLNTTDEFTYLESGAFDRLWNALVAAIPEAPYQSDAAAGQRCFAPGTSFPQLSLSIGFEGDAAGAGAVMSLDAMTNVFYRKRPSPAVCLAIRPSTLPGVSVIGSRLQSGRAMTISLRDAGRSGYLTF
ncbi:hypothetical protein ACP4OV_006753 [Aristida adscensionis]